MNRSVRFEHATQRREPRIRGRHVVENASAHDLIEAPLQVIRALDGQLEDFQIV